jgi:peptidoglycan-N-acetylglucosamine deacetylase
MVVAKLIIGAVLFGTMCIEAAVPALSSCGNGNSVVAMTFDDGPDVIYDDDTIADLEELGIRATFFVSPDSRGYDHDKMCDQARRLHEAGHELQVHSMTHPSFLTLSNEQIYKEIQGTIVFLKKCGVPSPTMFRPPYGLLRPEQARYIYDTFRINRFFLY